MGVTSRSSAGPTQTVRRRPGGAATRPRRRRSLALDQIVDAAGVVFAERGVANTTLRDVADALGVSRAALYYHVGGREELLRLVVGSYIALHREWLQTLRARSDLTPEERLRQAVRLLTRGFESHPHLSRIFLREETEMPPDLRAEQRRSRRVIQREVELILRDGIEARRFAVADPELATFGIFGMINWMHEWFSPRGRVDVEAIADLFADLILGGIRAGGDPSPRTPLQSAREIQTLAARLAGELALADAEPAARTRRRHSNDGRR